MPTVVYLRGEPGAGKKTAADILKRDLGWALCWLHSLDGVYQIVGHHPPPDVMDAVMRPVVEYLMRQRRNILFVRPARTRLSVESVARQAKDLGYDFVCVRLAAGYRTLLGRVCSRGPSEYRVYDSNGLDRYLDARPLESYPGEHVIDTDDLTPEQVAERVKGLLT